MAERTDLRQTAPFEDPLRACLYEQEVLRRTLAKKGLLSDAELLNEIKTVRLELEVKRSR